MLILTHSRTSSYAAKPTTNECSAHQCADLCRQRIGRKEGSGGQKHPFSRGQRGLAHPCPGVRRVLRSNDTPAEQDEARSTCGRGSFFRAHAGAAFQVNRACRGTEAGCATTSAVLARADHRSVCRARCQESVRRRRAIGGDLVGRQVQFAVCDEVKLRSAQSINAPGQSGAACQMSGTARGLGFCQHVAERTQGKVLGVIEIQAHALTSSNQRMRVSNRICPATHPAAGTRQSLPQTNAMDKEAHQVNSSGLS